jgi:hypothetical protein
MSRFNIVIPTKFGTIFLLMFAFIVAWLVIDAGEKIINNMPQSKIYDGQKAAQKMIESKK